MGYPLPPATNVEGVALGSAAYTATATSNDIYNLYGSGAHFTFVCYSATLATATVTIQGKDELSDSYYGIITGAAVTGAATATYKIIPGGSAVANTVVNDILPTTFRASVAFSGSGTANYSLGYSIVK